jgi:alpha-L-fucosidase
MATTFNPIHYDAKKWVELAKSTGMKYMIITSKHHDGFALWDSPGSHEEFTSYKTASKRDFVKEYMDACHETGMRTGLYYSPMDWRFPGYFKPKELVESAAQMKKQCYDQVDELCSKYGKLDILWYDGGWLAHKGSDTSSAWFWEPVKLNKMAKKHNPKMVINPRSGWEGNFYCDEGSHEIAGQILPVPWEKNMCVCSGSSWGWMPTDPVMDFDWLIRMMINVVTRDGNWLLNVGPDRNGKLSDEVTNRMREIGAWLKKYGDSVYGTRGGPFEPLDKVYGTTCKENVVYLHILDKTEFAKVSLPAIEQKILSCATFDGKPCGFSQDDSGIKIVLPPNIPEEPDTILKLTMDDKVSIKEQMKVYFTGKE